MARKFMDYFSKIADMLQELSLEIPILDRSLKLLPQNENLKAALVQVYKDIFAFLTAARGVFVPEKTKSRHKVTGTFPWAGYSRLKPD
jgi:hypothetical protein